MKKQIVRLSELSLFEWRVMLLAMLLLPVVALSLRIVGFKKTRNILSRFISGKSGKEYPNYSEIDTTEIERASVVARIVVIAAGHGPYRANCLKKSMVLWWLLARYGISSEIMFGVLKEKEDALNAHAWVECCGINMSDTAKVQQRYLAFES